MRSINLLIACKTNKTPLETNELEAINTNGFI
ncbi:unnamed protein product, partial [Brachionus calyciflorus]